MPAETTLPTRAEVPVRYTWDTESVFPTRQVWEGAVEEVGARARDLERYRGRLAEGPGTLADCLGVIEGAFRLLGKVVVYASNHHNVDTTDQEAAAMDDRATALRARVASAAAFLDPEMIAIGFDTLRRWIAEEPRLAHYGHYVDELERRQAHVRSAEVEALLGALQDPFATARGIHAVLTDADMRFAAARSREDPEAAHEVAQGTIDALLRSPDRDVRRTAFESYADAHLAARNTMATCLATGVKQHVFLARARGYGSALAASLDRNNIPTEVYHHVIDVYRRNLPVWHRYWRVRRRALGYDDLHVYDVKAPLSTAKPAVPLERAVEWIAEGMAPLGEEYVEIMRRGMTDERWVDYVPNRGKRAGAYSDGHQGTHPFILMSYTEDPESVSTLAHELGHSMHSYYTWRAQPYVYADYSIFVAEVASNLNQAIVRDHLLDTQPDRDLQIAVLEEAFSNFYRYFFIMPTLARFELEIHERVERGEALTAEALSGLMVGLFREGYGREVAVDEERVGITWAQFPLHLYSNFYVYQYTTGISAAHALAARILAGEPGALERYLAFLSAGNSAYPLDVLRHAGIDMTSPEPIQAAFDYLAGLIDRLEELL